MATKELPKHVGIIMDGNRRWARKHGVPGLIGHERGYRQAMKIAEHAFSKGVKYLTLYAFSTENWNRPKAEVSYLMKLMQRLMAEQTEALRKKNIKLRFIGDTEQVPKPLLKAMRDAEARTAANTGPTLAIAFNYGGRSEILQAVREIIKNGHKASAVTEKLMQSHLQTNDMPDPDLIIRTSGEERLSGFLLWQSIYSELYFSKKLWPSFTERDLDHAFDEYALRQRRFGA